MNIVDLRGRLPVHRWKTYSRRKVTDIRSIAIHHSLTTSGSPDSFARYHVGTNDWPGIGYTYVIGKDGTVYHCWDWEVVTYHVGDSNRHALGICLVGDFRKENPTYSQYRAAVELVRMLQKDIPTVSKVLGHCEYPGYAWKACPVINMDDFREDVREVGTYKKLNVDTAETIIRTWLQPAWQHANKRLIEERDKGNKEGEAAWRKQRDYYHYLAQDLRKAAGIETA